MTQLAEEKRRKWADYMRDYCARNKERSRATARASYYRHREARLAKEAQNRAKNSERIKAYRAEYSRSPSGKAIRSACEHKRRAAKAGSPVKATNQEIRALYAAASTCCYCGRPFGDNLKPTLEHRTPLSRGGSHSIDNLTIACGSCNSRKGKRTEAEFATFMQSYREVEMAL